MFEVHVGKGRRRQTIRVNHLNRAQVACMTELTQQQMFGQVIQRRPYSQSIHPFGRRRLPKSQWDKMSDVERTNYKFGRKP